MKIIIKTRDRPNYLKALLKELKGIDYLIIDDGSTNKDMKDFLKGKNVIYKGGERGSNHTNEFALNLCKKESKWIILDDDVLINSVAVKKIGFILDLYDHVYVENPAKKDWPYGFLLGGTSELLEKIGTFDLDSYGPYGFAHIHFTWKAKLFAKAFGINMHEYRIIMQKGYGSANQKIKKKFNVNRSEFPDPIALARDYVPPLTKE